MSVLKRVRVLFDEYHSEARTISAARAGEINPEERGESSYARAAAMLAEGEFILERNTGGPLTAELLKTADLLVLAHPRDSKWGPTTSPGNSPAFAAEEIEAVVEFVRAGGGLLVVSDHEYEKYGTNLNALLAPFGLEMQNTVLTDRENAVDLNRSWVSLMPEGGYDGPHVARYVRKVCSYRGGTCAVREAEGASPRPLFTSGSTARPKAAAAAACSEVGAGRVVLFAGSELFGDEHISDERFSHGQLWLNVFYWLAERALKTTAEAAAAVDEADGFTLLAASINQLRAMQEGSGAKLSSVDVAQLEGAVSRVHSAVQSLQQRMPYQADYFRAFTKDLDRWRAAGFGRPNFADSLSAFRIERSDDREYAIVFPMYLQNASDDIKFDCILMSVVWPPWLAAYERSGWKNDYYVPADIKRYSQGYESDCVVFFPEMVAGHDRAPSEFGMIFRNREAARVQSVGLRAAEILRINAPPQMWCFLNNINLMRSAFSMLDLLHDTTHSRGSLPRVLFKEKGRRPYWMHGLEELRGDLGSWIGASEIYRNGGEVMGLYVCWSLLFDRVIRYPITGPRVKNYDGLAGQVLANALFDGGGVIWQDGVLSFDWDAINAVMHRLNDEIAAFEREAVRSPSLQNWARAYDLIARYVPPNAASRFKSAPLSECVYDKARGNFATVLDDEFPLSDFHGMLKKQVGI